jgi:hypothetical protein
LDEVIKSAPALVNRWKDGSGVWHESMSRPADCQATFESAKQRLMKECRGGASVELLKKLRAFVAVTRAELPKPVWQDKSLTMRCDPAALDALGQATEMTEDGEILTFLVGESEKTVKNIAYAGDTGEGGKRIKSRKYSRGAGSRDTEFAGRDGGFVGAVRSLAYERGDVAQQDGAELKAEVITEERKPMRIDELLKEESKEGGREL